MVPGAGIEPARRCQRGILNPLCLPISPLGLSSITKRRWRRVPESNRTRRICNPLHNRFVNAPSGANLGAGNETRTRDPDLGKVVLYQLSYSRIADDCLNETGALYVEKPKGQNNFYHSAFNRLAFQQPDMDLLARSDGVHILCDNSATG